MDTQKRGNASISFGIIYAIFVAPSFEPWAMQIKQTRIIVLRFK
jgi:hypothetical protein